MKPPVGTTYYDPDNDIFVHKVDAGEEGEGTWYTYFPEKHESLDDDEAMADSDNYIPLGATE